MPAVSERPGNMVVLDKANNFGNREVRALLFLQDLHESYISSSGGDAGENHRADAVVGGWWEHAGDGRDLCGGEVELGPGTERRTGQLSVPPILEMDRERHRGTLPQFLKLGA